jgi:hypothetical protein
LRPDKASEDRLIIAPLGEYAVGLPPDLRSDRTPEAAKSRLIFARLAEHAMDLLRGLRSDRTGIARTTARMVEFEASEKGGSMSAAEVPMSTSLTLSQIAAQIGARLEPVLPDNEADLWAWLQSPHTVGLFLDALAVEPTRLRHAVEELIASFARRHSALVRGYLRCAVPLPTIAKDLLRFLVEAGPPCDATAIWDAIAPIDQRLDEAIAAHLPSQRERFTLCGYGLGDGGYEQQLAERFAAHGTTIELFGYDPTNARFDTERIQPCSLATVRDAGSPRFDVILSRWVLHHVPPNQRWDGFVACVRQCQPGGSLLIVEEGPFSAEKNPASLIYELLSSGADVLVNSVVYPDWLAAGDPPGEHFYLAYLTPADITALEGAFAMPAERHLEWHQAGYLPQILIRYDFGTPVPLGM